VEYLPGRGHLRAQVGIGLESNRSVEGRAEGGPLEQEHGQGSGAALLERRAGEPSVQCAQRPHVVALGLAEP
jgi:hypothetical protein